MEKKEGISVSLPKELVKEIDRLSEKQGVSRSEFVEKALRIYFGKFVYPVGQEKKAEGV